MMLKDLTQEFQVFLFDFDGLLVDTEHVHFEAFKKLLAIDGFHLDWDFVDYVNAAHFSTTGLKDTTLKIFPDLEDKVGPWAEWYPKKKPIFISLVKEGVSLMPGAERLIRALSEQNVVTAVVTHSLRELVEAIKSQHPCLDLIGHWYTRELYKEAKPSPECYNYAIDLLCRDGDKAIGFEDSPRGIQSLINSLAKPVWVGPEDYPGKDTIIDSSILHIRDLNGLFD